MSAKKLYRIEPNTFLQEEEMIVIFSYLKF